MKRILFAMMMLAGALSAQAQTESSKGITDINALAKKYAKEKDSASICIENPGRISIEETADGYDIEVEGRHLERDYRIKITHNRFPTDRMSIKCIGINTEFEGKATFKDADRITLTKGPHSQSAVIVKDGEDGYTLSILQKGDIKETRTVYIEKDTNWDFKIPFKDNKKKQSRFKFSLLGDLEFGMGLVSAHSQAPGMDIEFGNAGWEFFLNNIVNWEYTPFKNRKTHLSLGFGVDWRNYRMKGESRFLKDGQKLTIAPYPEGANIGFSRIKVFSMTLELMLRQDINKYLSVAAGPIVNFNTHASIKTRYETGSGKEKEGFKETSSSIPQKAVTVDFKAEVTVSLISLYFKYSPTNTLDTEFGPGFKSMSAGLVIGI